MGEGVEKYRVKCTECGKEMEAFVTAEKLNSGTSSCTECGSRSSFTHVEVETKGSSV